MSSVPPSTPPGGTPPPYPPYDSKTQWRVYRAQQRAAWKAQRDAWKAQSHAWKASYVSAYGPRVPSVVGPIILIGIGIVALLVLSGRIGAGDFCRSPSEDRAQRPAREAAIAGQARV